MPRTFDSDPRDRLPPGMDEDGFREIARNSDTLFEVTRRARVERTVAKQLLRDLDLEDEVARGGKLVHGLRANEEND